jgi:metallophosphoesterase (TIGR00282 family)
MPRSAGDSPAERGIVRILAVGDIYGSLGRRAAKRLLPGLRAELHPDLVIVNGENSAGGRGISMRTAREIRDAGADVITTGNHVWAQPDINQVLDDDELCVIRPLNYPDPAPGTGMAQRTVRGRTVTVINAMGRVFMDPLDDPFRAIDTTLLTLEHDPAEGERPIVLVDFHAEATSEKQAIAWYLAGRVSAVFGTHTHVPTADARVLPGGTGYVTDLGMTGPYDSIIGASIDLTIQRFLTQRSLRLRSPDSGDAVLNAVMFDIDAATGACLTAQRVDRQDAGGVEDDARAQGRAPL